MTVKMLDKLTLEELTETYICNKYGKDPIKCIDCDKHESCPAGKRAIELLNEMTECKKLTKQEKGALSIKLKARQKAAELIKMEDPIKYLVEVDGLKISAAQERMRKYKRRYPDLFENRSTAPLQTLESKTEVRKADYEAAKASGKPTNYYMEKYGLSYDAAWHRWKYEQKSFDTPIQNKEKEENVMNNDSEEEISLEDFLNQHETEENTEPENKFEKAVDNEKIKGCKAYTKMGAKYEELICERDKLTEKLNWYNEAIRSFEMVMDILYDESEGK